MPSALGQFLQALRAGRSPEEVGLPPAGRRRVPGLRREEVALLAGVSVDYLSRLEQGRERRPSSQVLDALSSVYGLDDDGRTHLFDLAGQAPGPPRLGSVEVVDPALQELLDSWPRHPALILGQAYDVLASNRLGAALFGGFERSANLMYRIFLDPDAPSFYADWPTAAANSVAGFRLQHGAWPDDQRIREVLEVLVDQSPEFARLWAQHQVRGKTAEVKTFRHPEVGPVTVRMLTFDVRSNLAQQLVVYQAGSGTRSAEAISLLGSLDATEAALAPD